MKPRKPIKLMAAICGFATLFVAYGVAAMAVAPASEWVESTVISSASDQVLPSVSGDVVVWMDYRNQASGCPTAQNCTSADIFTRDLSTGAELRLTAAPNGLDPDISGNRVVWRNWDTGKIMVHDLDAGSDQYASAAASQMVSPSISGNRVVWIDYRNSIDYGDVYMRDLTQPAETPVSLGSALPAGTPVAKMDKRNPDLDGDIAVWEDMRNAFQDANGWWHNPDIYVKNLATGEEQAVCTDLSDQYNPVVAGHRVFWQDYRNNNWDVYMKDLDTGVETRLTNSVLHQSWPSASGDFVVWKDQSDGDEEIYFRDLSGLANGGADLRLNEDPVSSPAASQKLPVISGARAVWMDKRGSDWDIYDAHDAVAPQAGPVSPQGLITADSATVTALYSDGTGIDRSRVTVNLDGAPLAGCNAGSTQVDCALDGLAEGSHTIDVTVADFAGNTTASSAAFSVDSVKPVITAPEPVGSIPGLSPVLSASYSDAYPSSGIAVASVTVTIDGAATGCTATPIVVTCPQADLADGDHLVSVSVSDTAGNTAGHDWSFSVNGGPLVSGVQPAAGAVINNATPAISGSWSPNNAAVDAASVHLYIDGLEKTSPGVTFAEGSFGFQPGSSERLGEGAHSARLVVADVNKRVTDQTWSFTVTSPSLSLEPVRTYWASYSDYLTRELTVDYRMSDRGTGAGRSVTVELGTASNGVMLEDDLPTSLEDIDAGAARDLSFSYQVPAGVGEFMVLYYASYADDGGNRFWWPGTPPASAL